MIQNCPITATHFTNTHTMFGPNIDGFGMGTVQQNPYIVVMEYINCPRYFIKLKVLNPVEDVVFLYDIPFVITTHSIIKFFTIEPVPTYTAK